MNTTSTQRQNIHLAARRLRWDFSRTPAIPLADHVELASFLLAVSWFVVAFEDVGIPIVRETLPLLDGHPELAREARTFVSQEALHSQAHALYNEEMRRRHSYDTRAIERESARFIETLQQGPLQDRVACVAALEHVIYSLADWYERSDALHARIAPDFHRLMLWHCMEETEHTAVVHDIYEHLYGTEGEAYRRRVAALARGTRIALRTVLGIWRALLPQVAARSSAPRRTARSWAGFVRESLGYAGEIGRYFKPGFEPWTREMLVDLLPGLRRQLLDIGASEFLSLQVAGVDEVASDVRAYTLRREDGGALPGWQPGAHLDVEIEPGVVRQYSLCGDPAERHSYRIAVKREVLGRGGSLRLHQEIARGSLLRVGAPRNHFALDKTPAAHTLLLAGGIGITPLLAMARQLHRDGAPFSLHLCSRHEAALPFAAESREWPFAAAVTRHLDSEAAGGRIDVGSLIPTWDAALSRRIYVCGPTPFIAAVEAAATRAGWPAGTVHSEKFAQGTAPAAPQHAFTVTLAQSGREVAVGAEQTLLEALEADGLKPANACREGICGACVCQAVAGEVEHRDAILSHEEQAAGRIAICVSRAKGERLTLDI